MSGRWVRGSRLFSRQLDDDFARLWRILKDHPECVVLGLGVFLRVSVYLSDRSFWMDEASLWGNLAHKPILDFSEPLKGDQLAPLGFLIVQRALMSILGVSKYAARLLPLVCGVGSLFLFARLAHRILAPPAGLDCAGPVLLFGRPDLLLERAEAVFAGPGGRAGRDAWPRSMPWESQFRDAERRRWRCSRSPPRGSRFPRRSSSRAAERPLISPASMSAGRDAAVWMRVGIGWLVSFFVSYRVSQTLLSPYTTMYLFWDFAFLPVWPLPMDRARLEAAAGISARDLRHSLEPGRARLAVGRRDSSRSCYCSWVRWSLARRSWATWAMLVLPIVLAMVASAMERYPFHGRLILELVPAFFVLIAEGAETVRGWEKGRVKPALSWS